MASGLRRFYYPSPPYNWSFLKPFVTLTLAAGAYTLTLPDDFAGMDGRISVATATNGWACPLDLENPGKVEMLHAENPTTTGRPRVVAIIPIKGTAATQGQLQQLYFYPIADASYLLTFCYYYNPDYLVTLAPYALGGGEHSETIMEWCMAVFEERYDGMMQGPHAMAFAQRMQASIALDRRKKPQVLGVNTDLSDDYARSVRWEADLPSVTYNGQ